MSESTLAAARRAVLAEAGVPIESSEAARIREDVTNLCLRHLELTGHLPFHQEEEWAAGEAPIDEAKDPADQAHKLLQNRKAMFTQIDGAVSTCKAAFEQLWKQAEGLKRAGAGTSEATTLLSQGVSHLEILKRQVQVMIDSAKRIRGVR